MTRQRIHELAKAWDVTPQEILAQFEKMGNTRKTVQSSLTEVGLEYFQDLNTRDVVEAFELEQIARRLEPRPQHTELRLSA